MSVEWGGGKLLWLRPLGFKGMGFEIIHIYLTFLAFKLALLNKSSN